MATQANSGAIEVAASEEDIGDIKEVAPPKKRARKSISGSDKPVKPKTSVKRKRSETKEEIKLKFVSLSQNFAEQDKNLKVAENQIAQLESKLSINKERLSLFQNRIKELEDINKQQKYVIENQIKYTFESKK